MIVLVSASCSYYDVNEKTVYNYVFSGENDLWGAEYTAIGESTYKQKDYEVKSNGTFEYVLTVSYKGDMTDLYNVRSFRIEYESLFQAGRYSLEFPEDGKMKKTYTIKSQGDRIDLNEDEIIKVTIFIDGETQELELKPTSISKLT